MSEKILLKDILFNKAKVAQIAFEIQNTHASFPKDMFVHDVLARLPDLELKARITWIADCLNKYLPDDYSTAVQVLVRSLPKPNDPTLADDDFGDFMYAPYAAYVARYGCTKAFLTCSLNALYEITQRFSAEDAVRYFINAFPDETLEALSRWSRDTHYHVRRLCSEGTRPKLPWSSKINIPITTSLPILDVLFADPTRYVTRSVANHMNDISKIDAHLVVTTLLRWKKSKKQTPKEMEYIIRHSLRTLVKAGDMRALALLGFTPSSDVCISGFTVPPKVVMDTALEFSFVIATAHDKDVLIDYVVYFQSKDGKRQHKKVFKLTQQKLVQDVPVRIFKRHMLRAHMTTRTLYPGLHTLEIQVNGSVRATASFMLANH